MPTPVAVSNGVQLLFLFLVLPFLVAGGVLAFISWRSADEPTPVRTSEILASGELARGVVRTVKPSGSILDVRPMVRFEVSVTCDDGSEFDLEVTQSVPRPVLRDVRPGSGVRVRLAPGRTAGALVLGTADGGGA